MSEMRNAELAVLNRKFAKTCVEKKRRDRINRCLDELKDLMSGSEDKAKYQKMEKAEILEMAVNYMKTLRSNSTTNNSEAQLNQDSQYFALAYKQCLAEFQSCLNFLPGVKDDLKTNVFNYMNQRYLELVNNAKSVESGVKRSKSVRYSPYQRQTQLKRSNTDEIHIEHLSPSSLSSSNYMSNQFSGSCSSLDSCFNTMPANFTEPHNESSRSAGSSNSSPNMSTCSSPNHKLDSDINFANFDLYQNCNMKVWRPW